MTILPSWRNYKRKATVRGSANSSYCAEENDECCSKVEESGSIVLQGLPRSDGEEWVLGLVEEILRECYSKKVNIKPHVSGQQPNTNSKLIPTYSPDLTGLQLG